MSRETLLPRPEGEEISLTSSPCALGDTFCSGTDLTSSPFSISYVRCNDANRFAKLSKRSRCTVSTMVLSGARGLRLFRVIRGGIGFNTETGCQRHHVYRPSSYSPSNPSVSQNRLVVLRKDRREAEVLSQRRSSCLLFQFLSVEAFSLLPKCQRNRCNLTRQRETSHGWLHAFGQQSQVELAERPGALLLPTFNRAFLRGLHTTR